MKCPNCGRKYTGAKFAADEECGCGLNPSGWDAHRDAMKAERLDKKKRRS